MNPSLRREGETVIGTDRVAVWQRVFTAEPKLKKPRPPSHTPLAPKLYGLLHSTHKQPAGSAGELQAGHQAGWKQQLAFYISAMTPRQELKLHISHLQDRREIQFV